MMQIRLCESMEKCFSTLEVPLGYCSSLEITLSCFDTVVCDSLGWNKQREMKGQKRRIRRKAKEHSQIMESVSCIFKAGFFFFFLLN